MKFGELPQVPENALEILAEDLLHEEGKVAWWRLFATFMFMSTFVLVLALFFSVNVNIHMMDRLSRYKGECVTPDTVDALVQVSEQLTVNNKTCLRAHQEQISVLKEALPGLFEVDKIAPRGVIPVNGKGEYTYVLPEGDAGCVD